MRTLTLSPKAVPLTAQPPPPILYLLGLVLITDLILPIFIGMGLLPAELRWISHVVLAGLILFSLLRMLAFDRIPVAAWAMAALTATGVFVAVSRGQGLTSTLWGWWLFFQFLFAGLFIYLSPSLPANFSPLVRKLGLAILALEVVVQGFQYLSGVEPGDSLSGTLGGHGTGALIVLVLFIDCLLLGYWIVSHRWLGLAVGMVLSMASSLLGEMKLFPFAILCIGALAVVIYAQKTGSLIKLVKYALFIAVILVAFVYLYNLLIPGAATEPLQQNLTNPQWFYDYLNRSDPEYRNGQYYTNIGRNYALSLGWKTISQDPVTLLFGLGLGARSESVTLGTVGIGIQSSNLGLTVGTSLLVIMQELGLFGLVVIGGFFVWAIVSLVTEIRRRPLSPVTDLRYALVLFSLFWPIWLWYNTAWTLRVPMLLYWVSLGYALAEAHQARQEDRTRAKVPQAEVAE